MASRPRFRTLVARRALGWSVGWALSAALYLLLIDSTDTVELIVGAIAAALAATAFELAREQGIGPGRGVGLHALRRLHRPLVRVPVDVAVVSATALRALVRRPRAHGVFRAVPFESSSASQPSVREALAEALGSLAPNTIIVGVDRERDLILAHQLHPSGGRDHIDVLEFG
jgi:multisubunit Na+/H+ antiporter MnhE subunit